MTFEEWWDQAVCDNIDAGVDQEVVARLAWDAATKANRELCEKLIRQYLVFDSQRAVSYHEVQDCLDQIHNGA